MRTHIELDEQLITQAIQLGHYPTKKAAIHAALLELVNTLKRQQLLTLRGKVSWQGNIDQLRSNRTSEVNDAG
jgi:Arc/MetJ family transcription regulator